MIHCPQCATDNIPNTLFCDICGADLRPGAAPPPAAAAAHPGVPARAAPRLYCLVQETNQWLPLPTLPRLVLGRADAASGSRPDLDLSPFRGAQLGVSRRHAQLHWGEHGLLLEDLGSMNGTFINEQRLPPQRPVALPQGAQVRLGTLRLRFELRPE